MLVKSPKTTFDYLYHHVYYVFNCKLDVYYDPNEQVSVVKIFYPKQDQPLTVKYEYQTPSAQDNWQSITIEACTQLIKVRAVDDYRAYTEAGGKVH